jgi:PAS domain S-box-containing protein
MSDTTLPSTPTSPLHGAADHARSAAAGIRRFGARLWERRRQVSWSSVVALLAGVGSLLVLVGWAFGVPSLKASSSEWPTMKANAALGVLLCSVSLWLLQLREASRRRFALGRVLAAIAVAIGLLTLLQELYHFDLRIDQLLFTDGQGGPFTPVPGRMAPSVALGLALLGLALIFLDTETGSRRWPAEFLATVVLLLVLPRLVGYAYGMLPSGPNAKVAMGPYDSVLLALVAIGILAARPERGIVSAILSAPTAGGRAARRLVPAALLIPFVVGALAVAAGTLGLVDAEYLAPLAIAGVMIAFSAVAIGSAWSTRRTEAGREAMVQRLQAQHAATRALIESTTVAEASPRFLASIAESLRWDFAALWQMREPAGELRCAYTWHCATCQVSEFEQASMQMAIAPGVELPGMVWVSGQPAWVPDILRSPSLRGGAAARSGLRAGFAFPVRYGPEIRGVIEFFSREVRDPDPDLVAVAPILGGQIGEAIERKRAEELLRASEDRFRAVAQSATDALVTVDARGVITWANRAAERMFGRAPSEMLGAPLSLLLPEMSRIDDEVVGRTVELTARGDDGGKLPVELSAARWATAEGLFFTAIIRDISTRKRTEQELRQARDAAEASNRELEAFSYSVSHDLRTPVRSIDGFSQALLEDFGEQLGVEGRESLSRVRAGARRMSQLIDDILELSRTSRAALHRQTVDLSAIALEVAEELRTAHPERHVAFHVEELLTAWCDARLMRVALQNILDNAWKFTAHEPGPEIEFGAHPTDEGRIFFVRDNGIGFDMAFRDRLFSPFQRLHDDTDFPGTGVGLALVQRIILRHGGRIWAESAVGKGATFYFTLPGPNGG